jgi:hypothetical protein
LLMTACQQEAEVQEEMEALAEAPASNERLRPKAPAFQAFFMAQLAVFPPQPNAALCGPGKINPIQTGQGLARQLGRITVDISSCAVPGTGIAENGEFVLTAANGDELHLLIPLTEPKDPNDPMGPGGGDYIVTGGTGRFEHAVGSGTGYFVPQPPDFTTNPPTIKSFVNLNGTLRIRPMPFRASFTSQVTPFPSGPNPSVCPGAGVINIQQQGSGRALHMGRITTTISSCAIPGQRIYDAEFVLTAANGDELYLLASEATGETIDYVVTGGTGRFENARGSGQATSTIKTFDPANGIVISDVTLQGVINYE